MADTSLIFNVIARDSGLGRVLTGIEKQFKSVGDEATAAMDKANSKTDNLDKQIAEAQKRVKDLADEFERTGDKTLFSKINRDKSLINQLQKIRTEIKGTGKDTEDVESKASGLAGLFVRAGSAAGSFASTISSAGSSVSSAVSSISGLVLVIGELAAAEVAAAPAVYVLGGAIASLPALISGAIAAIAVLKLGTSGLSENWTAMNTPKAGGGGGGGSTKVDLTPKIRAVTAAQQEVAKSARDAADAQVDLKAAQDAVAKSYVEAANNLRDLNLQLRESKTDQATATQDLLQAEEELRLAQARGNPDEIMKAQLAVDKQKESVEEATNKTNDLGKEYADASRKGIEGSDAVVQAKKAEHDAEERLADAVQSHSNAVVRLSDAQRDLKTKTAAAGAAAAAAGAVIPKIAANAQDFLNELKKLKPAFDDLRLDIQQRLFDGLAGKLAILAQRWLPALHSGLGGIADTINGVVKTAFDSLSKPTFIKNMLVGLDAFRGMLGKIGQALAGPFIDAWGRLTAAASPVLGAIGDGIAGLITQFSAWIKKVDDNGSLDRFMNKAAHIFGTVFKMITDLVRIAGDLISILFGTKLGGTDAWDNLEKALHKIADWMGNPDNQAKVGKFLNIFGSAAFWVGDFLAYMDKIPGKVESVVKWFQAFPGNVSKALSALPGVLDRWSSAAVAKLGYWIGYGIGWVIKQFIALPGNTLRALIALPGIFARIGTWLLNALANLYPWMLSVGKNIVIGIWNGIVSLQNWLWNKAADFAAGIWKGVKSALGIGSPSKVMAREVGRWIPAGIAQGWMDDNSIDRVVAATATKLANTTLPAPSMDDVDAGGASVTVGARRLRIDVRTALDVTGQEGKFKTLVRGLARTDNLYQTKG